MRRMQPLEPPTTHLLSAALGWLGLGAPKEARAELDQVSTGLQNHPEVLEVRWQVSAEEKRWHEGLQIARSLLHHAPERASGWLHQAYALRRIPEGGLKSAWDALLPAREKFPEEPLIPYNLACYASQMAQFDQAREWLRLALALGGKEAVKRIALEDEDLKALWDEIKDL
jgi:predicted Zn-dependent protease